MATYKFKRPNGEIFEIEMSVFELDEYKKNNPELKQLIYDLNYVTNPGLKNKVPDGFRDVLRNIKENNPGSTINVP
ncbi:MAG: hypothetical protein ABIL47_07505 [candidate division WOR-3 bacterium]